MQIKIGDAVSLKNGKTVTIREQHTSSTFRGAHAEQTGESLAYYRLEDISAFAGQMDSTAAAEWAVQIGVEKFIGR